MNLKIFVLTHQQEVKILERLGRFKKILKPGFSFKLPFFDEVAYHHSLKEQVLDIDGQTAITKDNVKISIDGVLYFKIMDPYKASYAVSNPINAIALLAQTSMRSEIGKLVLDRTFEERQSLNINIKKALNQASEKWGVDCLRYEIKDIKPPDQIKRSMELQAESERIKRSKILHSEGEMMSKTNIAEAQKRTSILDGQGTAEQILQEAKSLCEAIKSISNSLNQKDVSQQVAKEALNLRLQEQYIDALHEILGKASVLMLPEDGQEKGITSPQNIAQILATYKHMTGNQKGNTKLAQMLSGDDGLLLRRIVQDLDDIKHNQGGQDDLKRKEEYKYLDDKTLYSTDA